MSYSIDISHILYIITFRVSVFEYWKEGQMRESDLDLSVGVRQQVYMARALVEMIDRDKVNQKNFYNFTRPLFLGRLVNENQVHSWHIRHSMMRFVCIVALILMDGNVDEAKELLEGSMYASSMDIYDSEFVDAVLDQLN